MTPLRFSSLTRGITLAVLVALFTTGFTPAASAQIPDARTLDYLDSALLRIRMTRSDLAMHWDQYPDDAFRLRGVKHMFEDPMSTFGFTDKLAHALLSSVDAPKDLMAAVASPLDITLPSYSGLAHRLSAADLQSKYNFKGEKYSPALRAALVEVLSAIAAADELVRQARGVYTPDELRFLTDNADSLLRESEDNKNATLQELKDQEIRGDAIAQRFLALAQRYPRELICQATAMLLQSVNVARMQIGRMSPVERDTLRTSVIHTPAGDVAIGGEGSDTYEGRFLCIIDIGGDDVYRQPGSDKEAALARPVSVILDGGGNDVYTGDDFALASGYFGVSVIDDAAGNDMYRAGSFSMGSGMFGAGVLIDREGNDHYGGGTFVQGAGAFGVGLLIDLHGNDTYEAQLHAQGFGFTWGLGAIVEAEGNDTYSAAGTFTDILRYDDHFETLSQGCGLGIRPFASGGIGVIAEANGNDTYLADIYGQGAGYWFALGGIVDDHGNDRYMSYQYAQGAGIHFAFGVLLDKEGTDYYNAHGVSMGCGHDVGFGGLLDLKGDDFYATEGLSLGGGNANAVSFFCDVQGDDGYLAKAPNTFGYSDNRRAYGMIGVFMDLGGKDYYPSTDRDNTTWTGSWYGVGMDVNIPDTARMAQKARQATDDSARAARDLGKDIRTLFLQASAAPQKYQYLVEPARKALIERKTEAIPYLLTRLNATSPRERLALTEVLPKMGDEILRAIVDSIHSPQERSVAMALFVMGKMADSADAPNALPLLNVANWRVRANACEQLGLMKNPVALGALRETLARDTIDMVRMRAAGALIVLRDDSAAAQLISALSDRSQLVRYKANEAIDSLGDAASDAVYDAYPQSAGFARQYLAELVLKNSEEKRVVAMLPEFLADNQTSTRAAAIAALERRHNKKDGKLIAARLGEERDTSLIARLQSLQIGLKAKKKPTK